MIKKQLYIIPETEVLEVRFEGNFCGTNPTTFNSVNGTEEIGDGGDEDF